MTRRGKRTRTRWALLSGNEENFTRRVLERLERLLYDLWLSEILNMGLCGDFLRQTNVILLSASLSATRILIAPSFEDLSPLITHFLVVILVVANQLSARYMLRKPWKECTYVATCLLTEGDGSSISEEITVMLI